MSQLPILVPASRLTIDPKNVRKARSAAFQAQMKASIAAKGIIQNLVGRPVPRRKGHYYVSAGGSRLEAVNANIADGTFDADYPVPLLVRDGKDASETSLIENVLRADLTPTEECRGYQDVVRIEHVTPAELAKRLHRTERYVLGRLRLADLAEPVFDALEADKISLEVAEAYGSTSDTARQATVYDLLHDGYSRSNVNEIRRQIASYSYPTSDPRCRLVGRDAYLDAGGRFDSDLFTDADNERWLDTHIVDRLAEEALLKAAAEIEARDGYAEVRAVAASHVPYMETYSLETIRGEQAELTSEQEQRLEAIVSEIAAIQAASEDPDYEPGDDDDARIGELQAAYQAIEARPAVLDQAQRANARAYLVVGADGQPRLHHDFFVVPAPDGANEEGEGGGDVDAGIQPQPAGMDDASDADDAVADSPAMSQVQIDRLATMKTELLAVHVASDPAFALDLGTFIMAERATRDRGGSDIPSELSAAAPHPRVRDFESGTAAAVEWTKLDAALDRDWVGRVTIEDRYDAFCALSDEARAAWLGWAVARTLHAVPMGDPRAGLLDRLGLKLGIDVAGWWRPTAHNFFDKLAMKPMLALFERIGGPEFRARYGGSKKHDLAVSAERLFAGDTIVEADIKARALAWVPDAMRFGPPPAEPVEADDADDGQVGAGTPANDADDAPIGEAA